MRFPSRHAPATVALAAAVGLLAGATTPAMAGDAKTYSGALSNMTQQGGKNATTVSGQMRSAALERRAGWPEYAKVIHWRHSAPYPDNKMTVSGQMRSANLERKQPLAEPVYPQYSSAADQPPPAVMDPAPLDEQVSSTSCPQQSASNIRDTTGEPGTRALNYLMVAGCTQYENFRQQGDLWAAEVPNGNREQTVLVNPDTGDIDVWS